MTARGRSEVRRGPLLAAPPRSASPAQLQLLAMALLAMALLSGASLLSSCSDPAVSVTPPVATQPAGAPPPPAADEDLPALVRFWITNPRLDPGAEAWRLRGEEAARLALATYADSSVDSVLRQQAVVALGHFEMTWVGEELGGILLDRDKPDAVRIAAGRSLVEHALLVAGEPGAVSSMSSITSSPDESAHLRGAIAHALALLPLPAARAALELALQGELQEGLADRMRSALVVHDLELETRRLAAMLDVKVGSTIAEFVPVSESMKQVGVPGPDVIGDWKPAVIIVSALSSMPEPVKLRIDYDPRELGLLFADEPSVTGGARFAELTVSPGQRKSTTRRVDTRMVDVSSEVWVYVEGHAPPVIRLPVRIQAEPAVK